MLALCRAFSGHGPVPHLLRPPLSTHGFHVFVLANARVLYFFVKSHAIFLPRLMTQTLRRCYHIIHPPTKILKREFFFQRGVLPVSNVNLHAMWVWFF